MAAPLGHHLVNKERINRERSYLEITGEGDDIRTKWGAYSVILGTVIEEDPIRISTMRSWVHFCNPSALLEHLPLDLLLPLVC